MPETIFNVNLLESLDNESHFNMKNWFHSLLDFI